MARFDRVFILLLEDQKRREIFIKENKKERMCKSKRIFELKKLHIKKVNKKEEMEKKRTVNMCF